MNLSNIKPKTIFTGDNLPILRGMNSESIDLIYLDPPFNSKANYAAPIGSKAAGAEFKDTWTLDDIDTTWLDLIEIDHPALNRVIHAAMTNSDKSYLIYMAVRLLEMHRVLKPTGSIYLHCDSTMGHYLKLVMDAVFGKANFRNEIVWQRDAAGKGAKRISKQWPRLQDVILLYSKTENVYFDQVYIPLNEKQSKAYRYEEENTGRRYKAVQLGDYTESSIEKMDKQGLIHTSKSGNQYKKYYLDEAKATIGTLWTDIPGFGIRTNARERTGYPTQKPLELLDRIIKASSSESGIVLDPFCGCATTCVAADRLQREWIGIDISPKAAQLVVERIKSDQGLFQDITHRTDVPKRTDLGDIPRYNTPENKQQLYGKQEGYCNGCKEHFQSRLLEVDHIIATSVGGTDHIDNLQLLCSACNRVKGNRGQEYLLTKLNA